MQMTPLGKDIVTILQQCKAEIQANMAAKGINASGRTSRAFEVVTNNDHITLILSHEGHTAPLQTLEVGRPAGRVPGGFFRICKTGKYAGRPDVSNTFKYILMQWAKDKRLTDFGWGAATNLGRKIAYEGTDRHKTPVQVWTIPVNRAKGKILTDIRAVTAQAIIDAAQSQYPF